VANFATKIIGFLLGNKSEEKPKSLGHAPLKERPKIPRETKLMSRSKSCLKTREIMNKQLSKSLEEFNNSVDECKKWLDSQEGWYIASPAFTVLDISATIGRLNRNELLALRVANLEYVPFFPIGDLVSGEVENALKKMGRKYILRKDKR